MRTQLRELIDLVQANGWKCSEIDNFEAQEWSLETWLLESEWTPVDRRAYITIPVDPQVFPDRIPIAIQVSQTIPHGFFPSNAARVYFSQWKNEKESLIAYLSDLRKRVA